MPRSTSYPPSLPPNGNPAEIGFFQRCGSTRCHLCRNRIRRFTHLGGEYRNFCIWVGVTGSSNGHRLRHSVNMESPTGFHPDLWMLRNTKFNSDPLTKLTSMRDVSITAACLFSSWFLVLDIGLHIKRSVESLLVLCFHPRPAAFHHYQSLIRLTYTILASRNLHYSQGFYSKTKTFLNTMYKQLVTMAALLAAVSAGPIAERSENPDQVAIGRFGVPHGNLIVAWAPSKTTQEEACTTRVRFSTSFFPFNKTSTLSVDLTRTFSPLFI